MNRILLLVLMLVLLQKTHSQALDSTLLEFFPLHMGDTWQYLYGSYNGSGGEVRTWVVTSEDSLLPDGNKYFKVTDTKSPHGFYLYRIDSSFQIWSGYSNYYRLNEKDSSIWLIPSNISGTLFNQPYLFRFNGISKNQVFGAVRDMMVFQAGGKTELGDTTFFSNGHPKFILLRGFGIYFSEYGETSYTELIGAIINGMRYGTLTLGIKINNVMSKEFNLSQNYPNPFNGTTIIEYKIQKRTRVRITVYDVLGQELSILVDEEKNGGNYKIKFNSNNLSSGLYFYRLTSDNFAISKTMLLMR